MEQMIMSFKTVTEQVHNPMFQALAIILDIAIGLSLTSAAISTYNGTVTIDLSQTADTDVYKGSKDGTAHSLQ